MGEGPYELIIIGAGPAGLTAGIYAARSRLKTLLIEKMPLPGGLAAITDWIENYPGFEEGVTGPELTRRMAEQARRFGLESVVDEVRSVRVDTPLKTVVTGSSRYVARALIIATGTEPRKLDIPGESRLRGKGVSYCATCDGPIFRDKEVVVVGTGNSGLQEGLFLSRYVRSISFVDLLPKMTGQKILQEKLSEQENVKFFLNHRVTEIKGEATVDSVVLENLSSKTTVSLHVQGVFVYAGLKPLTKWLQRSIELDENGYVLADENLQTSAEGVFAAGDVRKKNCRQVATAVGDGALAALMVEKHLSTLGG
jgi:thioredoxin reductase (NADPH)